MTRLAVIAHDAVARAGRGGEAYASDTLALRQAVEELLSDEERIKGMSPLDHWGWAQRLPECEEPKQLPAAWADAVGTRTALEGRDLHRRRAAAWHYWENRKRVLDPAWQVTARPRARLRPWVECRWRRIFGGSRLTCKPCWGRRKICGS